MNSAIRNVSETALWVAMYRAFESERADAVFRDPFARRLAGERGAQILATLPRARSMAWAMIVRTAVMDELVVQCAARGATAVLNLAAGLDTRAYRLQLPPQLRWLDVDLPDMVAYKREQLAGERPVCAYEAVAVDLTCAPARAELFQRVAGFGGKVLVVTEGLLVYLADDVVASLADDLRALPNVQWWLLDLVAPMLLKWLQRRWGAHVQAGNAPFRFAPPEGTAFFAAHGFEEAEFRSMWEESRRLKRSMPMAWLWQLLGRLSSRERQQRMRRMSGIVLLERNERTGVARSQGMNG